MAKSKKIKAGNSRPTAMMVGKNSNNTNGGIGVVTRRTGASIVPVAGGGVRVRNTEKFVVPTYTTNTLVGSIVDVNPMTMTWLQNVAASYSQYSVRRMKFTYMPTCPTTANGVVRMGIMYDAGDAESFAGASWRDLSPLSEYAAGPSWAGNSLTSAESYTIEGPGAMCVEADVARIHSRVNRLVLGKAAGSTVYAERNQQKACYLAVQTETIGTASGAGEIYVTYDVEFYHTNIPQINNFLRISMPEEESVVRRWKRLPDGSYQEVTDGTSLEIREEQ